MTLLLRRGVVAFGRSAAGPGPAIHGSVALPAFRDTGHRGVDRSNWPEEMISEFLDGDLIHWDEKSEAIRRKLWALWQVGLELTA